MAPRILPQAALTGLRTRLTGTALVPADPGYDEARTVFNGMIDRRPAVVVQCETPDDVVHALRTAREHGLEIAVRGGGHSVDGLATTDGGLVVDLRRMHSVRVDPERRTATVGGGATFAHLDRATEPYGLATTGGRASTIGVGGFTLGGGSGWLERTYGLGCDNLLAADLVLAGGTTAHTDADHEPELFWALHGGGGNFGVATSLTLRLHPLPAMSVVLLMTEPEDSLDALLAYRDLMAEAPDEAGGAVIYLTGAPEAFVPEPLVGRMVCALLVTYAGTEAQARATAAPLFGLRHASETVARLPYADLQCMLDDPPGLRNHWSAEYLTGLPDDAASVFRTLADSLPVPSGSRHILFPMGGAVDRAPDDLPVPWRHAPWAVHPFGVWENPIDDGPGRGWVRGVRAAMRPWALDAVHLDFIGSEGEERVIASYGADNYRRLARVKAAYDPDNLFHLNHNIRPAHSPV